MWVWQNLFHDAAAWTEDYPRVNVFQRFTLSACASLPAPRAPSSPRLAG